MKKLETIRKDEKGFTLVELAIVMLIIGLLIGGVLKGAELVGNAEIAAVVAQSKNVEAGTSGFRDKYSDMPGDMANAAGRIAGATNATVGGVRGNSRIDSVAVGIATLATHENSLFWQHLDLSGFFSGTYALSAETPIDSVFVGVAYSPGAAAAAAGAFPTGLGTNFPNGHWITMTSTNTGAAAAATLRPDQAGRIDRKLDDGDPGAGDVRAVGTAGVAAGNCGAVGGDYNEDDNALSCGLYIRFQS